MDGLYTRPGIVLGAMKRLRAAVLLALSTSVPGPAAAQEPAPVPVGVDAIHAAMEQSRGYNLQAR